MHALRFTPLAIAATLALGLPAPAYADRPEYAGLTCGMVTTTDPSGFIAQDPYWHFGVMVAGPWIAADVLANDGSGPSTHAGASAIDIACTVQLNNPDAGGTPAAWASASGGGVAVGSVVIDFRSSGADNVYLCTRVTMTHGGTTEVYVHDADGIASNGRQCALAVSVGDPTSMQHVVTPTVVCRVVPSTQFTGVCV